MRIPLDYYRILGLPIQATAEQLRQAHRDRTLQLPRREYSDAAIAARKQLLDQAYAVLASADQRQSYDSGFLAKTYDLSPAVDNPNNSHYEPTDVALVDPHTPSVEIDDEQFIGALLILQELGEYELVLKLGRSFLTGGSSSLIEHAYGDPTIVFSDIMLTVALACLELGREQWQQGQYENAAEALETGQKLLLREGLFVNVRGEIQSDLYRLRPYRILELLATSDEAAEERRMGMELLEDMLQERGGIDGTENDQSGLSIDDFLKFIQQLRTYLTAEEQQYLFGQEANRPSAVATYLAVYALLARGFADRQPALIQQAKQYLSPLSNRQDVHLERSICSLLLGQTEEASQALELSQEQDSIAFIRQHSQQSPDLLPGLCLYTERWFHDEVFPHFRDLATCRMSLKEYFADRHVQHYLEALPTNAEGFAAPSQGTQRIPQTEVGSRAWESNRAPVHSELAGVDRSGYKAYAGSADRDALIATAKARIASRTAAFGSDDRFAGGVSTAERITQTDATDDVDSATQPPISWSRSHVEHSTDGSGADSMPPRKLGDRPTKSRSTGSPAWLIPAGALLGVVLLGVLAAWLFRILQPANRSTAQVDEELLVQLDKPLLTLTEAVADPTIVTTIDQNSAKQLIDTWLTAKSKAMGSTHDLSALDPILADPKLTEWRSASEEAKRDGWYRDYKHDVTIESVELVSSATGQPIATPSSVGSATTPAAPDAISPSPAIDSASPSAAPTSAAASPEATLSPSPDAMTASPAPTTAANAAANADQARVIANVTETTETFRNGKADGAAQTEQLRVQYTLVRKDGKWKIQDWQVQ